MGRQGPNPKQNIIMANGASVPQGKMIDHQKVEKNKLDKQHTKDQLLFTQQGGLSEKPALPQYQLPYYSLNYNEYIVYDTSQIKVRYLVQVRYFYNV